MNIEFENVQDVTPISEYNGLIKIHCEETCYISNVDIFFLNKNNEVVAHFHNKEVFDAEQLHEGCENLFVVNPCKDEDQYDIVWAENGVNTILNTYENIEFGIEDGTFAVQKDELWGFIDGRGREIIAPQYEEYRSFQNGYARVKKNGRWGIIDKKNKIVAPFKYYKCKELYGGYAVCVNEDWSIEIVNARGKVVCKAPRRKEFYNLGNGNILVKNEETKKYKIVKIEE